MPMTTHPTPLQTEDPLDQALHGLNCLGSIFIQALVAWLFRDANHLPPLSCTIAVRAW
jgi:hypothetical protein